jgi:hypothetical protein
MFMQKLFALVLGLFFVAGVASQAFAASPVEFSGYVKVYHESLSNFTRAHHDPYDRDSFFGNRLQIDVTFRPSDNVKVFWQFRGPDYQKWGTGNTTLFTRALYGEISFDWGTIRGGHIVDGLPGTVGGLASLGYVPKYGSEFLSTHVFDYNSPVDALTYSNKWELSNGHKFGLAAYYDKMGSNVLSYDNNSNTWNYGGLNTGQYPVLFGYATSVPGSPGFLQPKDFDYDVFGVEATYEWETGAFGLGLEYSRNMTDPSVKQDWAFFINPSFVQSFGPFAIHFEGKYGWGKRTYDRNFVNPADWNLVANSYFGHPWDGTIDNKGLGLYLDGVYTYDRGDVTIAGWYVSGTNLNEDRGELNSLVTLGDFSPFLVAFNGKTLGNGYYSDVMGSGWNKSHASIGGFEHLADFNTGLTNQWGVGIMGNHTIVPDFVRINYGIGYFRLVKPVVVWYQQNDGSFLNVPAIPANAGYNNGYRYQSKDIGWEIDLGFTFQIFENVSFETQFGYLFNGDAFDSWDSQKGGWSNAKDTFAWANVLAFTF